MPLNAWVLQSLFLQHKDILFHNHSVVVRLRQWQWWWYSYCLTQMSMGWAALLDFLSILSCCLVLHTAIRANSEMDWIMIFHCKNFQFPISYRISSNCVSCYSRSLFIFLIWKESQKDRVTEGSFKLCPNIWLISELSMSGWSPRSLIKAEKTKQKCQLSSTVDKSLNISVFEHVSYFGISAGLTNC